MTKVTGKQTKLSRKGPAAAGASGAGWGKYLSLVEHFPLRRISTAAELDRAIEVINALLDRDNLDPWEDAYLDVLSDLVERYETTEHPMEPVSDADMLQHLIEARGVTQADVAAAARIAESTISAVVRGKRKLARRHLESLANYFHVSPAVFFSSSPARSRS
jgi:HTH-type transcriptional regulator / antitoxin HigA